MGKALGTDEMVREVKIPIRVMKSHQTFLKFTLRKSIDFAIVSVAAVMTFQKKICTEARIVLGAIGPGPVRAEAAEKVLIGRTINADVAAKVAEWHWPVQNLSAGMPTKWRSQKHLSGERL